MQNESERRTQWPLRFRQDKETDKNPEHYIDGFLAAVPTAQRAAYHQHAAEAARVFRKHGALEIIEAWADDVPEGKLTSMPMAVKLKQDESVVFSWIVWPSKTVRQRAMQAVMDDPDMPQNMPFDGQRLIYGGFTPLLIA